MANVQLAVAGDDNTQVILSVPGVQGPTGSSIPPSGTTNQVLFKQSNTDYDTGWSFVTSAMIASGTIVNEDVNASAAIAGTKISPDFGSQNVITTGTSTAASFIPTSSSVPTNGVYLPSANNVAISASGTQRVNFGTGEVVFNETGENYDFRIEGDTEPNLVFVDASTNRVGLGTSSPATAFEIQGNQPQITIDTTTTGYTALLFATNGVNDGGIYYNGTDDRMEVYTADTSGNPQAVIDASGNVGIGTTDPKAGLNVGLGGDAIPTAGAATGSALFGNATGGNAYGLVVGAATNGIGYIQAQRADGTATTYDLAIQPNGGRVGINVGSPAVALDVNGDIKIAGNQKIYGSATTGNRSYIEMYNNSTGDMSLATTFSSASIRFFTGTTPDERARIDSSGRLLVGTSTARTGFYNGAPILPRLQVEGLDFNGSSLALIDNENGTTGGGVIIGRSRGTSLGSVTILQSEDSIGYLSYQATDGTDFVEAAKIEAAIDGTPGANDMPGRLVFSTTADGSASPTERMRITNSGEILSFSNSAGFLAKTSQPAGTSTTILAGVYGATSTQDGTLSFRVWSNGDVVNTNNSYGAISDIKLKENIVDANSQWDDLKALQVRNYNLKEGQPHTQIGLIAQEVELVSPGLISESPDLDKEGNDLGTVTKSVNYSVLYMKAVKALQEAMERIETLEAKVAALEGV
jgi:hypothetical protein